MGDMWKKGNGYSGNISMSINKSFIYRKLVIDDKTQQVLAAHGCDCYGYGKNTGPYYVPVNNLQGSIHPKNKTQNNSAILFFDKPFAVKFYKKMVFQRPVSFTRSPSPSMLLHLPCNY